MRAPWRVPALTDVEPRKPGTAPAACLPAELGDVDAIHDQKRVGRGAGRPTADGMNIVRRRVELYSGSVFDFERDLAAKTLVPQLEKAYSRQVLGHPSESEVRSWERSLAAVAADTKAVGLDGAGILIEHMLPLSSKRLDVLLFGRSVTGTPRPIVIELKQWASVPAADVDGSLVTVGGRLMLHPQRQVAQYVEYLSDFHPSVYEGRLSLGGAAYLHDATNAGVAALRDHGEPDLDAYPLFSGDQSDQLRALLDERLIGDEGVPMLEEFVRERPRPSKKLLEHVAAEIAGNPRFDLLDEQLVAFEATRKAVEKARRTKGKTVIVVTGGPGSGKSVIATRMLGDFAHRGWNVSHATGSRAFTSTLRKEVGRRAASIFRYFNQFGDAEMDELDVLICDEAHRIRESSNSRFTPKHKRSTLPQVDELIQVAKVPVFLLDENQAVRPDEIGRVSVIEEAAERNGADLVPIELTGHFRAMGSTAYVRWVERLLGIEPGGPLPWQGVDEFELAFAPSVTELERWLRDKQEPGFTARLSAGFCWPWNDPLPDGTLPSDVRIDGWERPWNAKPGKKVKDAPESHYWASDPRGFGQVGCIYTAQGFEYDYGGVIMGPDLVWRDGVWVPDAEQSADVMVKRSRDFDALVRNVYKVLLTRGLRGCAVYALDEETAQFLAGLIPGRV